MLVDGLPPEAATWREDPPTFTRQDELQAIQLEETGRWFRYLLQINGVKEHQLPPLLDVRPKPPPRLLSDPQQIAAHLSQLMPRR